MQTGGELVLEPDNREMGEVGMNDTRTIYTYDLFSDFVRVYGYRPVVCYTPEEKERTLKRLLEAVQSLIDDKIYGSGRNT